MRQFLVYLFVLNISSIDVFASNGYSELMKKHPKVPKESAHGSIMAGIFRDKLLANIIAGFTTIEPVTRYTDPEEALVIFDKINADCNHVSDLDQLELVGVNQFKPERAILWKEMKGAITNDIMCFGGMMSFKQGGSGYMVYYFYILPQIDPKFEVAFNGGIMGITYIKFTAQDQYIAAELSAETFMLEKDIKVSHYTLYEKKGLYIYVRLVADGIATALGSGIPRVQKYIQETIVSHSKPYVTLKGLVEMAYSGGLHVRRLDENVFLVAYWFSINAIDDKMWNFLKSLGKCQSNAPSKS